MPDQSYRWFDLEGRHRLDAVGFDGVLHRISRDERDGSGTCRLVVDFETASAAVIADFIEAYDITGVTRVELA